METATGRVTAHKDPNLPAAPWVAETDDWAETLQAVGAAEGETLVAVAHTLYPHDELPERIYRRVVVRLDRLASASPAARETLLRFCRNLEDAWPIGFAERAETYRVEALKRLEETPAFTFVQRATVRFLYDDVEVWAAFGYEGAAFHLGGYVNRGFNDLDWLPPVPDQL